MLVIWSAASKNNMQRHPDRQPSILSRRDEKVIWGLGWVIQLNKKPFEQSSKTDILGCRHDNINAFCCNCSSCQRALWWQPRLIHSRRTELLMNEQDRAWVKVLSLSLRISTLQTEKRIYLKCFDEIWNIRNRDLFLSCYVLQMPYFHSKDSQLLNIVPLFPPALSSPFIFGFMFSWRSLESQRVQTVLRDVVVPQINLNKLDVLELQASKLTLWLAAVWAVRW